MRTRSAFMHFVFLTCLFCHHYPRDEKVTSNSPDSSCRSAQCGVYPAMMVAGPPAVFQPRGRREVTRFPIPSVPSALSTKPTIPNVREAPTSLTAGADTGRPPEG